MASIYGFRIHTLQPFLRRTKKALKVHDVSAAGGAEDAIDAVYDQLQAMKGVLQLGNPTFIISNAEDELRRRELEDATDATYCTLIEVNRVGRNLELIVETGREADHDALLSRNGERSDMKRKAALRRSLVMLTFPTAGDYVFMTSEVRGRSFSGEMIISWMTRLAQREAFSETEAGKREDDWLYWKAVPRIDGQRLDDILTDSSNYTLKLRRQGPRGEGMYDSGTLEVVQYGLKRTPITAFRDAITKMAQRKDEGSAQARGKLAAKDVATLVDAEVGGVEFTFGEVSFLEKGKKQTINSETVDQLFIYPTGGGKPTMTNLRDWAAVKIEAIAPTLTSQVSPED